MVTNALSIDVEEYYHGVEFEAAVPEAERWRLPSRVEKSVNRVLDLLDKPMWLYSVMPASRDGKYRRPAANGRTVRSMELPLLSLKLT